MEFLTNATVKGTEELRNTTKIPSALLNILKTEKTSNTSKNVAPPHSKIPKRFVDKSSVPKKIPVKTIKSVTRTPKLVNPKKPSRSMISLDQKKTPRGEAVASSRSTINSERKTKSREPTPRSKHSELQKTSDRIAAKKSILVFESMKEKTRNFQTEFMKKWEGVKNDLPPESGEYKLIALVKNNEGELVTKDAPKIKVPCAQSSLDDIKTGIQAYMASNSQLLLDSLEKLRDPPGKIGDNSSKNKTIEDIKKNLLQDNSVAIENILSQIECLHVGDKSTKPVKNPDDEKKIAKLLQEIEDLQTKLDHSHVELSRMKKAEEDRVNAYKKELEDKNKKIIKKEAEYEELKKKLESIELDNYRDKNTQKDLEEKLYTKTTEVDELKKKLRSYNQSSINQLNRNQEHEARIKRLEADLSAALKDVEKKARSQHSLGDQSIKYADEIRMLKTYLRNSQDEKERLNREIQALKKDIEIFTETSNQLMAIQSKAKISELENQSLRDSVKELESRLQSNETLVSASKELKEELSIITQSSNKKTKKIDNLEMELTKSRFVNQKLEEKIAMDRKLLKVRSNLIESLQTKENAQKVHLKGLFAEVGERKNDIKMLKTELLARKEEFQSLFSTLSAKQLELTRQEHMIKILQESNERVQSLRVKQESKIGRLEEEVTQLKHTLSLYQDAVLPSNELKRSLMRGDKNRDDDYNENLGYYVDERHRKQNMDKKYEK